MAKNKVIVGKMKQLEGITALILFSLIFTLMSFHSVLAYDYISGLDVMGQTNMTNETFPLPFKVNASTYEAINLRFPWKALDGNISQSGNHWGNVGVTTANQYLWIDLGGNNNVTQFYFQQSNVYSIRNFTIEGSKDSTTWVQTFNSSQKIIDILPYANITWNFTYPNDYRYYKLTLNTGTDASNFRVSEIRFFNDSAAIPPSNINTILYLPLNDAVISDVGSNFSANYSVVGWNMTNATYFIWNSNGSIFNRTSTIITGNTSNSTTIFFDDFMIGSYDWNVLMCVNKSSGASNCTFAPSNFSFKISASFSSLVYTSRVLETSFQTITANITLVPGTNLYNANLVYNTSVHSSTLVNNGNDSYTMTSNFDVPLAYANNENKTFYYQLIYSIGPGVFLYDNSTLQSQYVNMTNISKCTSGAKAANFTAYDEGNMSRLNPYNFLGTFEYWLGTGSIRRNMSINDLSVAESNICVQPNETFHSDAIIQYEKDGYVKRNYDLVNTSLDNNTMQAINLYLLETTASTSFIVSVRDPSQLPVKAAYIYVQRYYPGTGTYNTVDILKTDDNGNTVGHFEAETEDYKFIVIKNGAILYTSPVQKVYCSATPCTLPLTIGSTGVNLWTTMGNYSSLIYNLEYNETTKIWVYTYVDTSGTTHYGRLYVYWIDGARGKQTICNVNSTSNAASLTCNSTGYNGTIYGEIYLSRSPEILLWAKSVIQSITNSIRDLFGTEGLFWAVIVIMVFAFAGVLMAGPTGGIVGIIVGVIGATWIGVASFGMITIFGIIAIGGFIAWIIRN